MSGIPEDVTVYVTQTCPYCHAAKALLKSKGIPFKEVDVTGDDAMRERLVQMSGGRETVPQVFFGKMSVGGYEDLVEHLRESR